MLSFASKYLAKAAVKSSSAPVSAASKKLVKRKFTDATIPAGLHKLGKLNHVAVATADINKATSFYRDVLGGKVSAPVELPDHGVKTVFVLLGGTNIELLEPLGEKSPIANFLAKNPRGGMHHICLEVDNIENALTKIKASGITPIDPKPKIGAHGNPVVFLNPKDCGGVLVELEQILHENTREIFKDTKDGVKSKF